MTKHWHDLTPMAWTRSLVARLSRNRASGEPFSGSEGFTLLEILVVVAILGLLIGLVAPAALRQLSGARNSVAKQSIDRIGAVLDLYKLDVGTYPEHRARARRAGAETGRSRQLERSLSQGRRAPVDPWNRPYVYRNPSERAGHDFDLCSLGASGNAGQGSGICNP